jgi:hypothetical protein
MKQKCCSTNSCSAAPASLRLPLDHGLAGGADHLTDIKLKRVPNSKKSIERWIPRRGFQAVYERLAQARFLRKRIS